MTEKKQQENKITLTSEVTVLKEELNEEKEERIVCAPLLIPNQIDKRGNISPTYVIEKEAHNVLSRDVGVTTDHNGEPGKGELIESWILKQERDFQLPNGTTEKYPKGTWIVCINVEEETWQRIKNGELQGLSITEWADKISLKNKERE